MHSPITTRTTRGGMTLVELLVVVVIITTLVATAIPILNPTTDARRMREASRAVNGFIAAAQTRATQIGRPFGVALKRLSEDTGDADDRAKCVELYYVEQPAPYAGMDDAAFVRLSRSGRSNNVNAWSNGGMVIQFVRKVSPDRVLDDFLPAGLDRDDIPPGIFKNGDEISIDGKVYVFTDTTNDLDSNGFYQTSSGDPNGELYIRLVSGENDLNYKHLDLHPNRSNPTQEPYLVWTEPLPYQVIRQPTPTSNAPLQLPPGMAIDLQASGLMNQVAFYSQQINNTVPFTGNDEPIVIMFSPEGSVSRLRIEQQTVSPPTSRVLEEPISGQIALLVGRTETPPADTTKLNLRDWSDSPKDDLKRMRQDYNWLNAECRWVVINSSSGSVASIENAALDPERWQTYDNDGDTNVPFAEQMWAATEFVRQSARTGGR